MATYLYTSTDHSWIKQFEEIGPEAGLTWRVPSKPGPYIPRLLKEFNLEKIVRQHLKMTGEHISDDLKLVIDAKPSSVEGRELDVEVSGDGWYFKYRMHIGLDTPPMLSDEYFTSTK